MNAERLKRDQQVPVLTRPVIMSRISGAQPAVTDDSRNSNLSFAPSYDIRDNAQTRVE